MALQEDGWYLRCDVIWSKPNPMPESVTDRPTKSHEYLFLLAKSPRYYFDADAVREAHAAESIAAYERALERPRPTGEWKQTAAVAHIGDSATASPNAAWSDPDKLERLLSRGRNIRSVWTIATAPYPGAHFAVFPPALVEPCVKAGTSERGVCPECGAPWERVVERAPVPRDLTAHRGTSRWAEGAAVRNDTDLTRSGQEAARWKAANPDRQLGWRPSCVHVAEPVPAVVLDPFAGSGTTLVVAEANGRRGLGIDLSAAYLDQAMRRIAEARAEGTGRPIDVPIPFAEDGLWSEVR